MGNPLILSSARYPLNHSLTPDEVIREGVICRMESGDYDGAKFRDQYRENPRDLRGQLPHLSRLCHQYIEKAEKTHSWLDYLKVFGKFYVKYCRVLANLFLVYSKNSIASKYK